MIYNTRVTLPLAVRLILPTTIVYHHKLENTNPFSHSDFVPEGLSMKSPINLHILCIKTSLTTHLSLAYLNTKKLLQNCERELLASWMNPDASRPEIQGVLPLL